MADMKITFSTELRDFDRLQKAINEINKELMEVGKSAGVSSESMAKLFSTTGEVGRGVGGINAAIASMKNFKSTLDELAKTRLDLGSLSGDLGQLGKSIEGAFGSAQQTVLTRFKQSIADLKQEAERAVGQAQTYEKQAERARTMGNQAFADMYKKKGEARAVEAAGIMTEADRQQREMEDAADQRYYSASGLGRADASMNAMLAAGIRPASRALARMGTSFGGLGRAAGMGFGIAGMIGGVGASVNDWMYERPERIFAGEQALTYGQYAAAANLNPTTLALQRQGVGAEQEFMRSRGWGVWEYMRGATLGNIQALLSGGTLSLSPTEIFQRKQQQLRGLDAETFNAAYGPATQAFYQRQQQYQGLYKTFGTADTERLLTRVYGGYFPQGIEGMSPERAAMMVGTVEAAGGATTPDLAVRRARELYRGMYSYGMSQRAVEQLAIRQAAGVPGAADQAALALSAGGMQTWTGAQALSDVQAQYMAQQSYKTGYSGAELIGGLAGQLTAGGVPEPIAARMGASAAATVGGMFGQKGTLMSASLQSTLMQSGVTNFFQQSAIMDLMSKNRRDEATKALMAARPGLGYEEARNILTGSMAAQEQMTARLFGGKTGEVLKAGGLGTGWAFSEDQDVQTMDLFTPGQRDPRAARGAKPKVFAPSEEDKRAQAAGEGAAKMVQNTESIVGLITTIVRDGLKVQPDSMAEALRKVAADKAANAAVPTPTPSGQSFEGKRPPGGRER